MPDNQESVQPETNEAETPAAIPAPAAKKINRKLWVRLGIAVLAVASISTSLAILQPRVTFKGLQ